MFTFFMIIITFIVGGLAGACVAHYSLKNRTSE